MSSRELLELAAKAAGYRLDGVFGRGLLVVMNVGQPDQCAFPFDPLNDDGDALRLAVRVGMNMALVRNLMCIATVFDDDDGNPLAEVQEMHRSDPYAATRRAIVRAAAEIERARA